MAISMVGAMAVAMALAVPCASAAFLYLPPEEESRNTTHVARAGSDIGSTVAGRPAGRAVEAAPVNRGGSATAPPLQLAVTTGDENSVDPTTGAARAAAQENGLWHVRADETLREILRRWGGRAGVEVLFLTDRRYRLHEARVFEGSFADATEALVAALSHLPHAPVGELRPDGRTLTILHRMRMVGERQ